MMSKSSFFKLTRDEVRRNLWAPALSMLGFLFALPLRIVIQVQNQYATIGSWETTEESVREYLAESLPDILRGDAGPLSRVGLMLMAVLCGLVLFRFLHDRRQVDFYLSLPIRREMLYAVKFTAGVLLVLPAYFVCEIIAAAAVMGFGYPVGWSGFLACIGLDLLAFFTIYGVTILCTVLCGNSVFAAVLTGWSLVSVSVAAQVYQVFAMWYCPTYSTDNLFSAARFCPPIGFVLTDDDMVLTRFVPGYVIVGAAALVLSLVLFRKRKGEYAGTAVAFPVLRLPVKVYTCLVAGMGAACIMESAVNTPGTPWLLVFTAVAVAAVHCVLEAVYDANARAFLKHPQTLLAVAAASVLLTVALQNDVFGYAAWLPKESKLDWVEMYSLYATGESQTMNVNRYYGNWKYERLYDPEVRQAMLRLGELGVENMDFMISNMSTRAEQEEIMNRRDALDGYYEIIITYTLKSGKGTRREYILPKTDEIDELVNTVLYSEEYLRGHNGAFGYTAYLEEHPERLPVVSLNDVFDSGKNNILRDAQKISELVSALQADVLDFTPEQAANEGQCTYLHLDAREEGETYRGGYKYRTAVYPSYKRTLALLKEYFGYVPGPLQVEDVTGVVITDSRNRTVTPTDEERRYGEYTRMVTDPALLAELLPVLVIDDEGDRFGMELNRYVSVSINPISGEVFRARFPLKKAPEETLDKIFGGEVVIDPETNKPGRVGDDEAVSYAPLASTVQAEVAA